MRPKTIDPKTKGTISELNACVYLLRAGYDVYRNVSSTGPVDLLATKDGKYLAVDVKSLPVEEEARNKRLKPRRLKATMRVRRLTAAQKKLNVRYLFVAADGTCNFDGAALSNEIRERNIKRRENIEKLDAEVEAEVEQEDVEEQIDMFEGILQRSKHANIKAEIERDGIKKVFRKVFPA